MCDATYTRRRGGGRCGAMHPRKTGWVCCCCLFFIDVFIVLWLLLLVLTSQVSCKPFELKPKQLLFFLFYTCPAFGLGGLRRFVVSPSVLWRSIFNVIVFIEECLKMVGKWTSSRPTDNIIVGCLWNAHYFCRILKNIEKIRRVLYGR